MKMVRTLRGQVPASGVERLIVDDGVFTQAWVVTGFEVFSLNGTGPDVQGLLAFDRDGCTGQWDADDNRQIAWSMMFVGTDAGLAKSWIDPQNVLVRDLFIENFSSQTMNYLITIERRVLSEDQAIMALIQERSQDDL